MARAVSASTGTWEVIKQLGSNDLKEPTGWEKTCIFWEGQTAGGENPQAAQWVS